MSKRGLRALCPCGGEQKSITEILRDPRVYSFVGCGTYASSRERLRQLLREGKITTEIVANIPSTSTVEPTRYGSQRRRANLPLKNTRGDVMQGPRLTHDEQYDGPFDPNAPPPKYGAQRYHLPPRNEKGKIMEGPRRQRVETQRLNKRSRTYISFNGERLTAKRALVKHSKLRGIYWEGKR